MRLKIIYQTDDEYSAFLLRIIFFIDPLNRVILAKRFLYEMLQTIFVFVSVISLDKQSVRTTIRQSHHEKEFQKIKRAIRSFTEKYKGSGTAKNAA